MGSVTGAGRQLGLLLFLPWAIACGGPPDLVSEHVSTRHKCKATSTWPSWAMCIPPPHGRLLEGRPTSQWTPACDVDLDELVAPCGRGVVCDRGQCSCRCDHDGDCRTMILGIEVESRTYLDRSSVCEAGRCVWADP